MCGTSCTCCRTGSSKTQLETLLYWMSSFIYLSCHIYYAKSLEQRLCKALTNNQNQLEVNHTIKNTDDVGA